jgi:hypothetical protein
LDNDDDGGDNDGDDNNYDDSGGSNSVDNDEEDDYNKQTTTRMLKPLALCSERAPVIAPKGESQNVRGCSVLQWFGRASVRACVRTQYQK